MPFRPDPFLQRFEPLRKARRRVWVGYAVGVAGVGVATAVRWAFAPSLEGGAFLTFFPALIVATFFGGWRSGLLALVLSAVAADYFFLPPIGTLWIAPGSAGALAAFLVVGLIVVAMAKLVNAATDRLAAAAERAAFVIEAAPAGLVAVDAEGQVQLVNAAVEQQLGYDRDELIGKPVELLIPRELRAGHVEERGRYQANPAPRPMGVGRDLYAIRRDGVPVSVEVGLSPFSHHGQRGTLASIVDITERKRAEQRQQILVGEVRHRSRNLLTIVRAIATRTLPKTSGEAFLGVLDALDRTQQLFYADAQASLREIIERELSPFRDQIAVEGGAFVLGERLAQDFTLIIHELATNSLKYGALSGLVGRVRIKTANGPNGLTFVWGESNGPVVAEPQHAGFGQRILLDVPRGFAAKASIEYEPTGLIYSLNAPEYVTFAPDAAAG